MCETQSFIVKMTTIGEYLHPHMVNSIKYLISLSSTTFHRIYGTKCMRCCEKITPDEMVMKIQNSYVYHVNCFVCCSCNQPLQKGEQFAFRGGQLLCRTDFEKESFMSSSYDDDYVIEEHHVRSRDGRRGPKRPRTILTSSQRRQFKASFDVSPKPCRKVREALAKDTGLSVRVVQVWFQNQVGFFAKKS